MQILQKEPHIHSTAWRRLAGEARSLHRLRLKRGGKGQVQGAGGREEAQEEVRFLRYFPQNLCPRFSVTAMQPLGWEAEPGREATQSAPLSPNVSFTKAQNKEHHLVREDASAVS